MVRMHKMAGYAIEVDFKGSEGGEPDDPRVNPDSVLLDYEARYGLEEEYLAWLEKRQEDDPERFAIDAATLRDELAKDKPDYHISLDSSIECVPTGEGKGVLIVRPLYAKDWRRSDDVIDLIELGLRKPDRADPAWYSNEIQWLQAGIYPNLTWMDSHTGHPLDSRTGRLDRWLRFRDKEGFNRDQMARDICYDNFDAPKALQGQSAGYHDHTEAMERVVPRVPLEVRDICEYGELLVGAATWREMRPALVTYWR